jgi:hypothetical protein
MRSTATTRFEAVAVLHRPSKIKGTCARSGTRDIRTRIQNPRFGLSLEKHFFATKPVVEERVRKLCVPIPPASTAIEQE